MAMKLIRTQAGDGIFVNLIKDDRFKHNRIAVNFILPLARETATGPQVHHARPRTEMQHAGDTQGMQHMVQVEVPDVLARDDIDLGIPLAVERRQRPELFALCVGQLREVVFDPGQLFVLA